MNRACQNCNRIITLPDLPLGPGYTFKCTACGFENDFSDEDARGNTSDSSDFGILDFSNPNIDGTGGLSNSNSWKATATAEPEVTKGMLDALGESIRHEFGQRLAALEARFDQAEGSTFSVNPAPAMTTGLSPLAKATQELILTGEVLLCTQSATLIQICENQLTQSGFNIQPVTNLETASGLIISKHFQVVILDQKFLKGEEGKTIMDHFKQTTLPVRRCQIIILISPSIPTCESQVFFQWGFDLNIHPRDLEKMGALLGDLLNLRTKMLDPYLATPKVH